ncbi:MAG: RNA 3'-terminal phosphate cyclase [Promethearchaeota archaeon]
MNTSISNHFRYKYDIHSFVSTQKEIQNQATVDEQLADQLILPLAMAPNGSSYTFDKLYEHVETNLKVIRHLMWEVLDLQPEKKIYRLTRQ